MNRQNVNGVECDDDFALEDGEKTNTEHSDAEISHGKVVFKRMSNVRSKTDLIEQQKTHNKNLKKLREENTLKSSIRKSNCVFLFLFQTVN